MNTVDLKEKTVTAAREAAPYVKPALVFLLVWTARITAWSLMLGSVWIVQYVIVVPLQFVWRLFLGVGLAALLLFVPIVGWVILAVLLYGRVQHGTPVLGEKHYSTRPWLLDPLLSIGR